MFSHTVRYLSPLAIAATRLPRLAGPALLLPVLALGAASAQAQAVDPPYRYTVRPGDTLITLARVYMNNPSDYLTVQKLNQVRDPRALPTGSTLLIPIGLLKAEPISGEIASFRGAVTVNDKPAAVGMKVGQGMRVGTGANAFVTLRLPDASTISLPSQSRILVDKLRRILLSGGLDRNFRLEAGRSRSSVTPMKDPASTFRVTTPLSVSAVRGTDFRVALDPAGDKAMTEVVGGTVGVAPDAVKPETSVPKAFGIIGTPDGIGKPIALLAPPQLVKIEKTATGAAISMKPIDDAKSYRTQLASDVNFTDIFDETVTDTPATSFTLPDGAKFFVRLTAIATSGLEGLPATYAPGTPPIPPSAPSTLTPPAPPSAPSAAG
jgi:hypothetical protein